MRSNFFRGMTHGIPIALGYLSVSFGFGIMAVQSGLSPLSAVLISVTNLTSAGQAAGVSVIAAGGGLAEMAATQLVINIRYALMAISLSQKTDRSFSLWKRLIAAYGITDEIFAVASAQHGKLKASYMYGLILSAFLGWTLGTALGASAGQLLPADITNAMGIVLYGMFIAIVIPSARKSRSILLVAVIAAAVSLLFKYLITAVSGGFAVIISAAAAAAVGALFFPVNNDCQDQKEGTAE